MEVTRWVLVVWSLVISVVSGYELHFKPGSSYAYDLKLRSLHGSLSQDVFRGYQMEGKVKMYSESSVAIYIWMELDKIINISSCSWKADLDSISAYNIPKSSSKPHVKINLLKKVVKFTYKQGTVQVLWSANNDEPWSIAIKKSILEKLPFAMCNTTNCSSNKTPQESQTEQSLHGICRYRYSFSQTPDYDVITKFKQLSDCDRDNIYEKNNKDTLGCAHGINVGFPRCRELHRTSGYTLATYNIKNGVPSQITTEGKLSFEDLNPDMVHFSKIRLTAAEIQPDNLKDYIQPNFKNAKMTPWYTLLNMYNIRKIPNMYDIHHQLFGLQRALSYPQERVSSFKAHIQSITRNLKYPGSKGDLNEMLVKGVEFLRWFSDIELNILRDDLEMLDKRLFFSLLPFVGTPTTFDFIEKFLKDTNSTVDEASLLIKGVAQNYVQPTLDFLNSFQKLCLEEMERKNDTNYNLWATTCISYGKMIHNICLNGKISIPVSPPHSSNMRPGHYYTQKHCTEDIPTGHIEHVSKQLNSSIADQKKVILLETLGHTGMIQSLTPLLIYARNTSEPRSVRKVAIYALHRLALYYPNETLPQIQPIFFNVNETYDIRIAAFTILLSSLPPVPLLLRIVSNLETEPNLDVRHFVIMSLQQRQKLTTGPFKDTAREIRKIFEDIKPLSYGYKTSSFVASEYMSHKFSFWQLINWVANEDTEIPKSLYYAFAMNFGLRENTDEVVEMGYNLEAFSELLNYIASDSLLLNKIKELFYESKPHDWSPPRPHTYNHFQQDFSPRPEFEATVFLKMFGSTSYLFLNKEYIRDKLLEGLEVLEKSEHNLGHFHFLTVGMPSTVVRLVQSDLAIPVIARTFYPTICYLEVEKMRFKSDINKTYLSVHIRPKLFYGYVHQIESIEPIYYVHFVSFTILQGAATFSFRIKLFKKEIKPYLNVTPRFNVVFLHHYTRHGGYLVHMPENTSSPITSVDNPKPANRQKYQRLFELPKWGIGLDVTSYMPPTWSRSDLYGRSTLEMLGRLVQMADEVVLTLANKEMLATTLMFEFQNKDHIFYNASNFKSQKPWSKDYFDRNPLAKKKFIYPDDDDDDYNSHSVFSVVVDDEKEAEDNITIRDLNKLLEYAVDWNVSDPELHTFVSDWYESKFKSTPFLWLSQSRLLLTLDKGGLHYVLFYLLMNTETTLDGRVRVYNMSGEFTLGMYTYKSCFFGVHIQQFSSDMFHYHNSSRLLTMLMGVFNWREVCSLGTTHDTFLKVIMTNNKREYDGPVPNLVSSCSTDTVSRNPHNFNCPKDMLFHSFYNEMSFSLGLQESDKTVPPYMYLLYDSVKSYLYPFVKHPDNNYKQLLKYFPVYFDVKASFSQLENNLPLVTSKYKTLNHHSMYDSVPFIKPPSSYISYQKVWSLILSGQEFVEECNVLDKSLMTFDGFSYRFQPKLCVEQLLIADCSEHKRFAVALATRRDYGRVLKIYVEGSEYKIGRRLKVRHKVLDKKQKRSHKINSFVHNLGGGTSVLVVNIEKILTVMYDTRERVKVRVNPWYRSRLCGLCGNYNGNLRNDFLSSNQLVEKYTMSPADECQNKTDLPPKSTRQNMYSRCYIKTNILKFHNQTCYSLDYHVLCDPRCEAASSHLELILAACEVPETISQWRHESIYISFWKPDLCLPKSENDNDVRKIIGK